MNKCGPRSEVIDEKVATQRTELGKRLTRHRERIGLSQRKFAERVFYDRTSITKIEGGQQSAPQAFWCEADRVLDADGELVAAFYALAATKERALDAHPADALAHRRFDALAATNLPKARAFDRVQSTSALAEHVNIVIELRALSLALIEHACNTLTDEPVDWAVITDKLDRAANACRRQVEIHPLSST